MEKLKKPFFDNQYSIFSNLTFMYKVIRQHHVLLMPAIFLLAILQAMIPILLIYFTKATIDFLSLPIQDVQIIIRFVSMIIILLWISRIAGNALEKWIAMYANRNRHSLLQMIENKVLTMDFINLESSEVQRARRKAIQAINSNLSGGEAIFANSGLLLQHTIDLVCYSIFISSLSIFIFLALVLSSMLITLLTRNAQVFESNNKKEESKVEQRLGYVRERLVKYETAKDIRLFSMSNWFTEYLRENTELVMQIRKKVVTKFCKVDILSDLLSFMRDGIAYAFLIKQVLSGVLTVGEFSFYLACIAGLSHWLGLVSKDITLIHKSSIEIGYLRSFLDIPDRTGIQNAKSIQLDRNEPPEIVFENVSFRYPNSSDWIIRDLNLTIRPREKLSIVGLNGAGKSTLVKMLCGFYPPTTGRILVDSIDVTSLNKEDYFSLFSAVFQENRVLAFDVQQNIALCPKDKIDHARLNMAISRAGLSNTIESFDEGIYTPLTRLFEQNGIILSGGQLQKLLLARALYKDSPVVVLDEPTSAMDSLAEADLYSQFSRLVEGKTAVFISHRLASTRFCDRIILLKDGHIEEDGCHDDLMKLNGEYARLFHVQAKNYREN